MKTRLLHSIMLFCLVSTTSMPGQLIAHDRFDADAADVIDISDVKVKFRIKVLGFARINGQFNRFSGYLISNDNGDPTGVSMRIDASSINTNDDERDAYLRGRDFFEADRFPHITFKGQCRTRSADGQLRLVGELKLRGHTRTVVFEIIENEAGNGDNSYMAIARIKRSDFGLNTLKHIVSDDVEIIVDL